MFPYDNIRLEFYTNFHFKICSRKHEASILFEKMNPEIFTFNPQTLNFQPADTQEL